MPDVVSMPIPATVPNVGLDVLLFVSTKLARLACQTGNGHPRRLQPTIWAQMKMWIEGDDAHDNDDGGRGGNEEDRQADYLVDAVRRRCQQCMSVFLASRLTKENLGAVLQ